MNLETTPGTRDSIVGTHSALSRRELLLAGTAALAASWTSSRFAFAAESAVPTADLLVPGKDRRLIVHNAGPLEIETPLELLREQPLTPVEALFVRNNHQPDWSLTLRPPQLDSWKIEAGGLVEYPRTIALANLAQLPQVEHEMVLQCSGNGREWFSRRSAAIKGSPWLNGAMANVRFRGVPLRAVLDKFEIRPDSSARFLTAEGFDSPGKPTEADFEHSLPLAEALERSILALELNGRPLPALHGGPVRLVTPGYYGTMHVKWLSRLRFEAQETVNHHQVKRYRTPLRPLEPGSKFDYALDNSEPNWNMRIKSVIFAPGDGERVAAGRVTFRGVAFNDGVARIDAVEWSRDGGRHWQRAELEVPRSRYAWHPWQAVLTLEAGRHTFCCRAVDTLGRTQPLDGLIDWNPAGYCWHGVHAVTIDAV